MGGDGRGRVKATLRRWGPDDLVLLERSNTPDMTRFLGGPESEEALRQRHADYLGLWESGEVRMFRVEVDGAIAGYAGWWEEEHDGVPVYEIGCVVEPAWQERGVASAALREVVRLAAGTGDRSLIVGYANVDNAASNALCERVGFTLVGGGAFPSEDGTPGMSVNVWTLDVSPLDLDGREPDVDETFGGPDLDRSRWWPHYTPHWASRHTTEAAWRLVGDGLELVIDADTDPWAPELEGDLRVSHLQTGQFSGPLGSAIGQHRFRPGLVVREEQPEQRLWLVQHGVIEARLAAIRHPDVMVAFWPIGFESPPDDCGELCIAEIFGTDLDDEGGWVGVGVKPQNDPRLREDFEKVRVDGDLTAFHDYAVEWTPDRARFFIDGRWVKTVAQSMGYPVQLMLDVYEFPRGDGTRDRTALPHVFPVQRVRTWKG
jgi:RimJ/RimL family protein N-acetyltransferase